MLAACDALPGVIGSATPPSAPTVPVATAGPEPPPAVSANVPWPSAVIGGPLGGGYSPSVCSGPVWSTDLNTGPGFPAAASFPQQASPASAARTGHTSA